MQLPMLMLIIASMLIMMFMRFMFAALLPVAPVVMAVMVDVHRIARRLDDIVGRGNKYRCRRLRNNRGLDDNFCAGRKAGA